MFVLKKTHEAVVREWDARCASLVADRQAETLRANRLGAELATFRQQQEQRRANLAKGTAASAAKRAQKREVV